MIPVVKIMKMPRDYHTMVTRKISESEYSLRGVAVNKKTGKGYNIELQMDTPKLTRNTKVKCYCSCPDFQFRWAYVLDQQGALLNPKHFQLTPPNITNPNEKLNACKHIHAFMYDELTHRLKLFSPEPDII